MKIALASPLFPNSLSQAIEQVKQHIADAATQGAGIVCFPESYLPGYPGVVSAYNSNTEEELNAALQQVCGFAKEYNIAVIMPMDWYKEGKFYNAAFVIAANGEVLGRQTKNQLDPSEDQIWIPGTERHIFEVEGLKFGIVICHEGFRYPELTRWAARRGAQVVFHPHFAGSDKEGTVPTQWGHPDNPYYEKAMMMRALENTIYFASVNYTTKYPESASSVIAPDGGLVAHQPYAKAGVLVVDIDTTKATAHLAGRFKPELLK